MYFDYSTVLTLKYALDNMFSRNTSKSLTFTVTSDEPIDEGLDLDNTMCGWLLKKRRKRMQGKLHLEFYYSVL